MKPVEGVSHVGIAVHSITEARSFYEKVLGAHYEGEETVPGQKVRVAFFTVGPVRLELLEPTEATSPVAAFLEKRGEGVHHIAYSVSDLSARLAELKAAGVRLIDEEPRPGAHESRIAFLHPKATGGVLTELCEPAPRHS
ncbi:MAG: methylmalonyl-CoA epimerase [Phycisphaerae bacterium]|jgi:methylmalonyl-CoA/ethylmalonyl-CoA epimerase